MYIEILHKIPKKFLLAEYFAGFDLKFLFWLKFDIWSIRMS